MSSEESFHQLLSLPENLLFHVFMKINNIPLCRIRQTCKFADSFAETYKNHLSSRLGMGVDMMLIFAIFDSEDIVECRIRFEDYRDRTVLFTSDVEKCLSAVPVKKFQPVVVKQNLRFYEEALKQLKRLKLRCERSDLSGLPAEWLDGMTSVLYTHNEIRIRNYDKDYERVLPIFNQDAFRSTEEFELQSFLNFFNGRGANSRMSAPFNSENGPYPPFEVLWELSSEEQERNVTAYISETSKHFPCCIRRIELAFKQALIVEKRYGTKSPQIDMTVYFLENGIDKIWEKLVEHLGLENSENGLRGEYCSTGESRRRELLRDCLLS